MDPQAPPVVAVVVTSDPGDWLEETLAALGSQDYPSLSVLVVDAASRTDPTARIAATLPGAYVRRMPRNRGFAAAANEALGSVEGASHLLFCHDDVAPDPDAVRTMMEEAYRSNAGVVTPKLVDWSDTSRLLQVGMGADKGGVPAQRVEPGELDQEQHDAVRDVFVAPGACTLVRADLFGVVGGFDDSMVLFREDVDLSWRAQVAGARVIVAPAARVRHLEAASKGMRDLPDAFEPGAGSLEGGQDAGDARPGTSEPQPRAREGRPSARSPQAVLRLRLERRNELRAVLKDYSGSHLARVLPQLVVLSVAEVAYNLLLGRTRRARAILGAWRSNLVSLREIRSLRRQVAGYRAVTDHDVRRLQARGSARLSHFVRTQVGSGGLHLSRGAAWQDKPRTAPAGRAGRPFLTQPGLRSRVAFWAVVALVLAYGGRQLTGSSLPVVGQLAHLPGFGTLLSQFTAGWRTAGLGSQASPPPGFGLLGLAGLVSFGSTGLLQKILFLGSLPLGAVGAYRMARPLPGWPRLLAALAYLAIPLAYNATAQGHLQALLVIAASPWLLSRLLRASGLVPFAGRAEGDTGAGGDAPQDRPPNGTASTAVPSWSWRDIARESVALAVVVALLSALVPAGFIVTFLTAASLAVATAVTGEARAGARVLLVGLGGIVGAAILTFPWSLSLISPGAQLAALTGLGYSPAQVLGLGSVVRFQTGGLGGAPLGWAFAVAAALALLIGRGWRLTWAARLWGVAVTGWAFAWMSARGWLGAATPPADVLLGPAAAATALAIGLGLVSFGRDLPRYRFGWRQGATLLAGACIVLGCVPVLSNALGGRWDLPSQGYDEAMSFLPPGAGSGAYRVLWIGDPRALPLQGWQLAPGVSYGTSELGVPDATDLLPDANPGSTSTLQSAIDAAWQGRTSRLGHLLASSSVRYIVVPSSDAPPGSSPQGVSAPPPPSLSAALLAQDDLRQLNTDPGLLVFENTAWLPQRAELTGATAASSRRNGLSTTTPVSGARAVLGGSPGDLSFSGDLRRGELFSSVPQDTDWRLSVAGGPSVAGRAAFGWATSFDDPRSGMASLSFEPPAARYGAVAVELLLWVAAIVALAWRSRRRRTWERARPAVVAETLAVDQTSAVAGLEVKS